MKREPLVTLPVGLTAGAGAAGPQGWGPARYVMGLDGGATKTLAAVLDLQEHVLHLGHGASSNPDAVGTHDATESLLKASDEAIARAGIARERLDAAVLAIAGTDTDAVAANVRASRPSTWVVVNDVVGAWAAATGARPGVGAISGTGSNVFGVGADGRAWRAGGWGHVLGDEGSGYWLAVQSIKAALADRERSGPETALSAAAIAFFDVSSIEGLATLVYSKPLTKGEIAAFAMETARVAHAGDAVARGLYQRAAAELGGQIAAVISQTGLSGEFPVGLIGSAFKTGALFVEPLAAFVCERAPQASVAVVEMAPVGGCILLAARVAGRGQALDPAELKAWLDAALAREGVFRE
ncbi:MAG TPA: BadF/BadG/BcrA/BcrD ATPase family protein [Solirubrobacteraceae bacterium]|jgi:glucosamine kinase|nr:BadF/BadG/BcrA/BcrD ATPase family protein [Solirubrobacteraceae bacterium]